MSPFSSPSSSSPILHATFEKESRCRAYAPGQVKKCVTLRARASFFVSSCDVSLVKYDAVVVFFLFVFFDFGDALVCFLLKIFTWKRKMWVKIFFLIISVLAVFN